MLVDVNFESKTSSSIVNRRGNEIIRFVRMKFESIRHGQIRTKVQRVFQQIQWRVTIDHQARRRRDVQRFQMALMKLVRRHLRRTEEMLMSRSIQLTR